MEINSLRPNSSDVNPDDGLFPISVVAGILGVHQRTLRIYDEENILKPQRSGKNRRLYSINDIEKGKLIQFLTRELGINLIGTKIIFSLLKDAKVIQSQSIDFLKEVALQVNITPEMQMENKIKLSKRGRKAAS